MLIYVAHPYGGKEENKKAAEEKIKKLHELYNGHTFISPIHSFGFMYDWVDGYEQGMRMCIDLLDKCDGLIYVEDGKIHRAGSLERTGRRNIWTLTYIHMGRC